MEEGKVEIVNANVLEATVNLSGGEALVQQGVQGLRWYREIMNVRPRYYWAIDICGWHEQMAQIVKGLGLDAFVYCRFNPTGPAPKTDPPLGNEDGCKDGMALHWAESPDGTRVLALNSGHYSDPDYRSLVGIEPRRRRLALAARRRCSDERSGGNLGCGLLLRRQRAYRDPR